MDESQAPSVPQEQVAKTIGQAAFDNESVFQSERDKCEFAGTVRLAVRDIARRERLKVRIKKLQRLVDHIPKKTERLEKLKTMTMPEFKEYIADRMSLGYKY